MQPSQNRLWDAVMSPVWVVATMVVLGAAGTYVLVATIVVLGAVRTYVQAAIMVAQAIARVQVVIN